MSQNYDMQAFVTAVMRKTGNDVSH